MEIILGNKYTGYQRSLLKLDILSLSDRREQLCLQFALKCTRNPGTNNIFTENKKIHETLTRKPQKYFVQHVNTTKLQNLSIIYMQHLLNEHAKDI